MPDDLGDVEEKLQLIGNGKYSFGVSEELRKVIKPRPLDHSLDDYWRAPSGTGSLGAVWEDKPHRLIYDLLAAILYLQGGERTHEKPCMLDLQ